MPSINSLKHHLHCKQMALTNVHPSVAPHPVTIITSVDIAKLLGKKLP
jgi:ethanolamine utilization protein EutA (predicted chaperonin)